MSEGERIKLTHRRGGRERNKEEDIRFNPFEQGLLPKNSLTYCEFCTKPVVDGAEPRNKILEGHHVAITLKVSLRQIPLGFHIDKTKL